MLIWSQTLAFTNIMAVLLLVHRLSRERSSMSSRATFSATARPKATHKLLFCSRTTRVWLSQLLLRSARCKASSSCTHATLFPYFYFGFRKAVAWVLWRVKRKLLKVFSVFPSVFGVCTQVSNPGFSQFFTFFYSKTKPLTSAASSSRQPALTPLTTHKQYVSVRTHTNCLWQTHTRVNGKTNKRFQLLFCSNIFSQQARNFA